MPTFLYSPGIRVLINNLYRGQVDVTQDVEQMQLTLNENNCHTISFTLSNYQGKYSGVFVPDDTIIVQMKRVQWLQIFTGYLDTVPYFSAFPRSVSFTGECTMKRIKFHWWDPGYQPTLDAIQQWIGTGEAAEPTDSGMSNVISSALNQVVGWPQDQIHIGTIPPAFFTQLNNLYGTVSTQINADNAAIFGGAVVAGNSGGATGDMAAFLYGERMTESTDNYTDPDGAYGFIPSTWASEAPAAGIQNPPATAGEASPQDQDQVAQFFAQGLFNQFGNWKDTAEAWFGGAGAVANGDDYEPNPAGNNNLSLGAYAARVLGFMAQYPGNSGASPAPVSNSTPAPTSATQPPGTGDKAVAAAKTQLGDQYSEGAQIPGVQFDCSGLCEWAWNQAGIEITRTTFSQWANPALKTVPLDQGSMIAGDLVYDNFTDPNSPQHVGMYMGDGNVIQSPHTGTVVQITALNDFTDPTSQVKRVTGNTSTTSSGAASGLTSSQWQPGQPVVADWNANGVQADQLSNMLTGYRVLMNDTPIMPFIDECCQAGLRHYCAAPNGDFIAWFPDYFGQYNYAAQMLISPLEIIDFTMNWSDQTMVTHQFTAGAYTNYNPSLDPTQGGQQTAEDMVQSMGIATIDVPGLFQALFNIDPTSEQGLFANAANIYKQFGARPQFMNMPTVASGPTTFYFAVALWMKNWASQFSADVEITFMPELWPGMLLVLPEFGFQAYVHSVTHSINMQEGGGFTTSVNVIAPSTYNTNGTQSGLYGLARGGPISS